MRYGGYRDLKVYQLAFLLTVEMFQVTRSFPKEERYSLTDQIRRSSRSVAVNLAEAWRRRRYPKSFVNKLIECAGEASETVVWVEIALACGYLDEVTHDRFQEKYDEVQRMLNGMMNHPEKFSG